MADTAGKINNLNKNVKQGNCSYLLDTGYITYNGKSSLNISTGFSDNSFKTGKPSNDARVRASE